MLAQVVSLRTLKTAGCVAFCKDQPLMTSKIFSELGLKGGTDGLKNTSRYTFAEC